MPAIEEGLVTYLNTVAAVTNLLGSRIYPLVAPQDAVLPAAAYQRISGPRTPTHGGPSGLAFARIQISVEATTYAAAKAATGALRVALDCFRGNMGGVIVEECFVDNEVDGYNEASGYSTVRMDFILQYQE